MLSHFASAFRINNSHLFIRYHQRERERETLLKDDDVQEYFAILPVKNSTLLPRNTFKSAA